MGLFKFASPPTLEVVSQAEEKARKVHSLPRAKVARNRVTGSSKAGRQLRAFNATIFRTELPPDIVDWNAAIDAKKEMKKRRKAMIRGTSNTPSVSG